MIKVTPALLRKWPLPDPQQSESKEDRGRVLIVGGTIRTPGAVALAAIAALRSGAGKLQVACGEDVALALAVALPEAMVIGLKVDPRGHVTACSAAVLHSARQTDALLVGPGMDDSASTRRVAAKLVGTSTTTVVLDAGALHAHSAKSAARVVLTPHLGEMAALTGETTQRLNRDLPGFAHDFAVAEQVTLVLKGAVTCIAAADGRVWLHDGGSVGLGTSGSGDVLAGVISGLAARGAGPEQAAVWGVWLHGKAGQALSRKQGVVGFLAREIPGEIPGLLR